MNIRSGSGWTIFVFGPEAQNNQMMRILSPDYGPNLESGGLSTPFISGKCVYFFINTFCNTNAKLIFNENCGPRLDYGPNLE